MAKAIKQCPRCGAEYEGEEWQSMCKRCYAQMKEADKEGKNRTIPASSALAQSPNITQTPERESTNERIDWSIAVKGAIDLVKNKYAPGTMLPEYAVLADDIVRLATILHAKAFSD